MEINGVPESIPRTRYVEMIESLGFDTAQLRSLEWRADGIYAEVVATDGTGDMLIDRQRGELVTHRVYIRVE